MIYFFLKKIFSVITLSTCYNFVGDGAMNNDSVVIKIMSDPKLSVFFEYLKTSNWRKLNEKKKINFYKKFNRFVCEALNIDIFELEFNNDFISKNSYEKEENYKNVIGDGDNRLIINDINYNQYLTIYEYLFYIRLYLLDLYYSGEYDINLSKENKEKIYKNFKNVNYGEIDLRIDKEDGEDCAFYQYIYKESRKFAETILFDVVRDNYDVNDAYDEEFFMCNGKVLDNEFLNSAAEEFINSHLVDIGDAIRKVELIKEKVEVLKTTNLSLIEDKDLFFMVYPKIIKNSDPVLVIKCFNEIIRRIYSDDMKVVWNKNDLIINENVYSYDNLENLLNIVLYECLNGLDEQLKKDNSLLDGEFDLEKYILSYKKKWLLSVIYKIDSSNIGIDFGVFKYQSIYRLLNKEHLNDILAKTSSNYLPFAKRGAR